MQPPDDPESEAPWPNWLTDVYRTLRPDSKDPGQATRRRAFAVLAALEIEHIPPPQITTARDPHQYTVAATWKNQISGRTYTIQAQDGGMYQLVAGAPTKRTKKSPLPRWPIDHIRRWIEWVYPALADITARPLTTGETE